MLDFVSILFTDSFMRYAAAPRLAFIVYGIQSFFTAHNNNKARCQDRALSQSGYFAWLRDWTCAPTHTIAGTMELYELYVHSPQDRSNTGRHFMLDV